MSVEPRTDCVWNVPHRGLLSAAIVGTNGDDDLPVASINGTDTAHDPSAHVRAANRWHSEHELFAPLSQARFMELSSLIVHNRPAWEIEVPKKETTAIDDLSNGVDDAREDIVIEEAEEDNNDDDVPILSTQVSQHVPIIVISSAKSPRRRAVAKRLHKAGLEFAFFDAMCWHKHAQLWRPGDLGCLLSYVEVAGIITRHRWPLTLVIEDDVLLREDVDYRRVDWRQWALGDWTSLFRALPGQTQCKWGTVAQLITYEMAASMWMRRDYVLSQGHAMDNLLWLGHMSYFGTHRAPYCEHPDDSRDGDEHERKSVRLDRYLFDHDVNLPSDRLTANDREGKETYRQELRSAKKSKKLHGRARRNRHAADTQT
ncbi:MAG: hypothetical protein MHM6MM_002556 [Cercozoa sp. M6MM]